MKFQNKVAGIIILYHPDQSVIENINSYLDQVGHLFIVDNSEKQNSFISEFSESNKKIDYIINNKNLGVAAALNLGAKRAIEAGYSYLLTMDQDSKATQQMVVNMMKAVAEYYEVGIISPFHVNKYSTKKVPDHLFDDKLVVMTSGNLLVLDAYKKVGPFKDEFFIDYVDTEYCMRLKLNEYKVIRVNNALLYHNEANVSKNKLFMKHVFPHNHSPFRMYFKMRNRCYLKDLYGKIFPDYFNYEAPLFRNMFIKILLFEKDKIKKFKFALRGYQDYKKNVHYSPFNHN